MPLAWLVEEKLEKPREEGEDEARGREARRKETFVGMIQGWWLRATGTASELDPAELRRVGNSTEECANLRR